MNSLIEIEAAIESLPLEEFHSLFRWIAARRENLSDRKFEADVKAGVLDAAWQNALKEIDAGEARPLDEICDDPDISRATRGAS